MYLFIRMGLESVMQSEVSQKEENKDCILTHICGIWKNGADEPCRVRELEKARFRIRMRLALSWARWRAVNDVPALKEA